MAKDKPSTVTPGSAWGKDPGFTVAQAAVALGVNKMSVYNFIQRGILAHVCVGGQKFVRQSHLDQFLTKGEVKARV